MELLKTDQLFLKYIRSISILIIVFGHVGGFWFYNPYSSFLLTVVPVFFFISGSVAFYSYERSEIKIQYFKKRFISLLVPYYLICLITLVYAFVVGLKIPYELSSFIKWVTMTPTGEGVPLGPVWFLRVLCMITLVSPFLFKIHKRSSRNTLLVMFLLILLAAGQSITNVGGTLAIIDGRMFIALIMTIYFVFGFYYYTVKKELSQKKLIGLLCFALLILFGLIGMTQIDAALGKHEYYPDLYYVSSGFVAIFSLLIIKRIIISFQKFFIIESMLAFFHKHTLSVFLIHGFGIIFADKFFGLALPEMYQQHNIKYGLIMFFLTLSITCLFSIPFTFVNSRLQKVILAIFIKNY